MVPPLSFMVRYLYLVEISESFLSLVTIFRVNLVTHFIGLQSTLMIQQIPWSQIIYCFLIPIESVDSTFFQDFDFILVDSKKVHSSPFTSSISCWSLLNSCFWIEDHLDYHLSLIVLNRHLCSLFVVCCQVFASHLYEIPVYRVGMLIMECSNLFLCA